MRQEGRGGMIANAPCSTASPPTHNRDVAQQQIERAKARRVAQRCRRQRCPPPPLSSPTHTIDHLSTQCATHPERRDAQQGCSQALRWLYEYELYLRTFIHRRYRCGASRPSPHSGNDATIAVDEERRLNDESFLKFGHESPPLSVAIAALRRLRSAAMAAPSGPTNWLL